MKLLSRRSLVAWLTAPLLGSAGILARAQRPTERYRRVPPGEGIGKVYMDREIAGVMSWKGAGWLERGEREKEERSDLLLRELGLRPGMNVADVGAGSGYYARRMAPLVAPGGKVYATDVQPEMVRLLTELARKANLPNIEPVQGTEQQVNLPADTIDLALMVDVYHELAFPYEVMDSLVRAVKPGGQVVFVEYRAEDPRVPIKPLHKMSEAQIRREAAENGLVYERTGRTLPWQHVVFFRKP